VDWVLSEGSLATSFVGIEEGGEAGEEVVEEVTSIL